MIFDYRYRYRYIDLISFQNIKIKRKIKRKIKINIKINIIVYKLFFFTLIFPIYS